MELEVREIYDKFNEKRKTYEAELADQQDIDELEDIANKIKIRDKSAND